MLSLLSNYTLRFGILTLLLVSGVFAFSTVNAQEVPVSSGCFRITGTSTPLTNANINEGQFDFNNLNPNDLYKACVMRQTAVGDRFDLHGWVWNTNLGWVSLRSNAGTNRGVSSGLQNYESYAQVTRDAAGKINGGQLYGYWWGDNLGWLNLNCATGTSYCATSNHRVVIGPENVDGKYPLSGYAWSDNLGWVNMTDVILDLNNAEYAFNPTVQIVSSTSKAKMYANGTTNYDIRIKFFDSAGVDQTATVNSTISNLNFCLLFTDKRKTINTSSSVVARNFPAPANCGGHQTTRTFGANLNLDFDRTNLAASEFEYNATGNYFGLKASNRIRSELSAQIGDLVLSKIKFNSGIVKEVVVNANLEFVEPFSFKILPFGASNILDCRENPNSKFGLTVGVASPFSYCGSMFFESAVNPSIRLNLPGNVGAALSLYEDSQPEPIVSATNSSIIYNFSLSTRRMLSGFFGLKNFSLTPVFLEGQTPILSEILSENFNGQGITTTISYNAPSGSGAVLRSGPSLTSVDLRIDQIATKGSIEDRAFNQIRLDSGSTSSGGAPGVQIREKLLRQISSLTSGKGNFSCLSNSDATFESYLKNLPGVAGSVNPTRCKMVPSQEIYYIGYSGNNRTTRTIVDIDDFDEMFLPTVQSPNAKKVLILVGADLIIDKNLFAPESDEHRPAIILLKNSSGKGGNVYFTSSVTDINAYIYADKTIYSVEEVADVRTGVNERPDRDGQVNDKMFSQIAFVGKFWSQNCIGCSQLAVPLKGDGSIALNREEAQDFDLNLWRFSPLKYTFVTEGGVRKYVGCDGVVSNDEYDPEFLNTDYLCWKDTVGSQEVVRSQVGELRNFESTDPQPNRRSVNIIYRAAPKDLPIFNSL